MAECIVALCDLMNQMSSSSCSWSSVAVLWSCQSYYRLCRCLRSPQLTIFVIYSLVMTVICIDSIAGKIDKCQPPPLPPSSVKFSKIDLSWPVLSEDLICSLQFQFQTELSFTPCKSGQRYCSVETRLHTGPASGTNSNLIIIFVDNVMLDFLMPALCRLFGKVVIFPIGGIKVVFLNICLLALQMMTVNE